MQLHAHSRLFFLPAVFAALSLSLCAAGADGAAVVATVDMELAILAHPSTAVNRAELQALQKKYRAERDEVLKRGDALARQYREAVARSRDEALSEKARKTADAEAQDRAGDIRSLEHELRSLVSRRRASLRKREIELFENVMADIRLKLDALAKERGATLVLDSSAERATAPIPLVMWSSAQDLTDALIAAVGGDRAAAEEARARADTFLFGSDEDEEGGPSDAGDR